MLALYNKKSEVLVSFQDILLKNQKYILFFVAALSLLAAGSVVGNEAGWKNLLFLGGATVLGVFWVYKVNDVIDYDEDLKFNLKQFFSNPLYLLYSLCILGLIIFGAQLVSWFRFQVFAFVGILGFVYSFNFKWSNYSFRLKNVFFFKNLAIGLAWGALIPIGSGSFESNIVVKLTFLTIVQVFIGSMIRDVPDREKDERQQVKSFPVVLGVKKTIWSMHWFNLLSFSVVFWGDYAADFFVMTTVVVIWRAVNLMMLSKQPFSKFWGQLFNLMTCVVILLVVMVDKLWV